MKQDFNISANPELAARRAAASVKTKADSESFNPRLWIILGLIFVIAAGAYHFYPARSQGELQDILHAAGLENTVIDDAVPMPDGIAYNGLHLDARGFNTIQSVTVRNGSNGRTLAVNKLALTGDWEHDLLPRIEGLNLPVNMAVLILVMKKMNISSLVLNGGQADLVLPLAGAVRVQAKGFLALQKDGSAKLDATLWGDQKQFKGQINVKGTFKQDSSSVDFEIVDGKIDLASLVANRIGGWVSFEKGAAAAAWTVSSQIQAAASRIYSLPLRKSTLSVQGTTDDAAFTVQSSGMKDSTAIAVDAQLSRTGKNHLTVTAKTDNIAQIIVSMLSSGDDGDENADASLPRAPGGIMTYNTEADKSSGLIEDGTLTVTDNAGQPWMKGGLRRNDKGMELDIQEMTIRNLARIFGLQKLNGEGMMSGLIDLHNNDKGGMVIEQGMMRESTPGVLSYDGRTLPKSVTTGTNNAADLIKSFAYSRIELSISSAEKGVDGNLTLMGHPLLSPDKKPAEIKFHFESEM